MRTQVKVWLGVVVLALLFPQVVMPVLVSLALVVGLVWVAKSWMRGRRWVR
ncbi:hypothetical protein IU421_30275 [Nocardia cyriacigeorgica]|uniref:hypothetical protein n=1 Tax=Nocardia cyriacigeorgica TaxID=135487 RepID=UPI001894740D|nr:hypothetical protein [Nocardia cyriacigeorgica]MBF6163062.1 hypothetical protein [Nocardia cyriacigeorgica]MBF6202030.1 hypothetical protein [Nocardia cyriacigeorgica]MBF6518534.1 hypothetical protein [Nocardia cyriacigeorgica]